MWPQGLKVDAWALVFQQGSALGVWVLYLMAPSNPRKYPYMMSCSLLNFEDLQWITPRNGVSNLWAANLDVLISKWTFFFRSRGDESFQVNVYLMEGRLFVAAPVLQDHFQRRRLNDGLHASDFIRNKLCLQIRVLVFLAVIMVHIYSIYKLYNINV